MRLQRYSSIFGSGNWNGNASTCYTGMLQAGMNCMGGSREVDKLQIILKSLKNY